jgi:hypothetical protein
MSPGANRRTREPTAAIVPEPSVPRTSGSGGRLLSGHHPSRMSASQLPTPAVWTAISTSAGSISGTGSRRSFRTSGPPNRSSAAARIVRGRFVARLRTRARRRACAAAMSVNAATLLCGDVRRKNWMQVPLEFSFDTRAVQVLTADPSTVHGAVEPVTSPWRARVGGAPRAVAHGGGPSTKRTTDLSNALDGRRGSGSSIARSSSPKWGTTSAS